MFSKYASAGILGLLFLACTDPSAPVYNVSTNYQLPADSNIYKTINDIPLPEGFKQKQGRDSSFADWLKKIRLKTDTRVFLYNAQLKNNQSAQFAVLDISVGDRDLQQCADAVMRLRAEFLFHEKKYAQIVFTDYEGNDYAFDPPYDRNHFNSYLFRVFGMCGSASLALMLKKSVMDSIAPGDVLIRGGFPGHAAMVMDVAVNDSGKKIFLLAQSYMPAQDIHLLNNPSNPSLSPWYEVNDEPYIKTPEYTFRNTELMKW